MSAARFREMFSLLQAVTQDGITVHIWTAASGTCLKLVSVVTRLPALSLGCFFVRLFGIFPAHSNVQEVLEESAPVLAVCSFIDPHSCFIIDGPGGSETGMF